MRRPKWSTVIIALALIGALAIASPSIGVDPEELVKKEVAKQIEKKEGPAGQPGAPGAPGADGVARAGEERSEATASLSPGPRSEGSRRPSPQRGATASESRSTPGTSWSASRATAPTRASGWSSSAA